jgi:hypothetical protein
MSEPNAGQTPGERPADRTADRDSAPFYVGYLPAAPAPLARWLKPRIALLLFVCAGLAAVLVFSQAAFGPSSFEFGVHRDYEGVIVEHPYPMLLLDRPHRAGASSNGVSRYYLTVFGKYGAGKAVAGLDARRVRLRG